MTISLVVAAATNNVIGFQGDLPWKLTNDMKRFKNLTWGFPVIMGRKSFDSLGKALPGRKNIIITRQEDWTAHDTIVVKDIDSGLEQVSKMDVKEAMVIGGGEIFKLIFPRANRIYFTRVHAEPDGDAHFPVIDPKEWELKSNEDFPADEKNSHPYSFQLWERKSR